ncbi:MAG: RibD family protein [Luteolibacter sp.]
MTRPWISSNLAISIDGKISPAQQRASGWTSQADHDRLIQLRHGANALMVGRGTLESDRMTLTVKGQDWQPLRCVVSRSGNYKPDHPIFHSQGGPIHWLVTGESKVEIPGAIVHHLSLRDFLHRLHADHDVKRLHCEGGGQLLAALAEMGAIDEFHLTLAAHTLFGGLSAPSASGIPFAYLPSSLEFELHHFAPNQESGECYLSYRRKNSNAREDPAKSE